MVFRLAEALEIANERIKRKREAKKMTPEQMPLITKMSLGHRLYPNAKNPSVNMSVLLGGPIQRIGLEQVQIICKVLMVDPNFLFGFPSKNDTEWNRIRKSKNE
jgi:hypothetical protein